MKENYNLEQQNDRKYIWNQKFQKQLIRIRLASLGAYPDKSYSKSSHVHGQAPESNQAFSLGKLINLD